MAGMWVDEIPTGAWRLLVDALTGASYYRVFEFSKYTGAPCFAAGYYRCPAKLRTHMEQWCIKYRLHAIEAFSAHTFLVDATACAIANQEPQDGR